jgi:hypothetical protein
MKDTLRKLLGEPVVVAPVSLSTDKPALDVHVYGDVTDYELQAYTAQTLGGRPEQFTPRWHAA